MYTIPAPETELTKGDVQACDLANSKTNNIQAIVHTTNRLVDAGILKPVLIKDQIRMHRVFGLYFLPEFASTFPESIVDLRDVHTVPKELLEILRQLQKRIVRLDTPFREQLAVQIVTAFRTLRASTRFTLPTVLLQL